jgi:hypothetical protein
VSTVPTKPLDVGFATRLNKVASMRLVEASSALEWLSVERGLTHAQRTGVEAYIKHLVDQAKWAIGRAQFNLGIPDDPPLPIEPEDLPF